MKNTFREQCKKNRLLDNQSYKKNYLYLTHIMGDNEETIICPYETFDILSTKVKGAESEVVIFINGNILASIGDGEFEIPVYLKKVNTISISGVCSEILLKCDIGYFEKFNNRIILPQNQIVSINNATTAIFEYSDYLDINENIVLKEVLDNTIFLQTYFVDDVVYLGRLIRSNGDVYFCSSKDNYANKTMIASGVNSAIFLQDYSNSIMYFMYINGGKLYYRVLDEEGCLCDAVVTNIVGNRFPISLIQSQTYIESSKCFGVIYDKNGIDIYYAKYNANFQKISSISGERVKIIEKEDVLIYITFEGYNASIRIMDIDSSKNNSNMLTLKSIETINNIIDCDELDDNLLLVSTGLTSWSRALSEE